MSDKVSIIIPVYNVEKYLRECLESVLNQTYKNIEVIVVNDGSKDNSGKIIDEYKNIYKSINVINQENKGIAYSRNVGIDRSTGKYIMFLDSDDFLETNAVELIVKKFNENNATSVIFGYRKFYGHNCLENVELVEKIYDDRVYLGKEICEYMLCLRVSGYVWNKAFIRESIKDIIKFDIGRVMEDWYPVFKSLSKCDTVVYLNEPIYNYRQRLGSITTSKINENFLIDYAYCINSILNYSYKINLDKNNIKKFKIETFNILINKMYDYYNEICKLNIYYDKFNKMFLELDIINIQLAEIIIVKNIKLRTKLEIIIWKMKLYVVYRNIKNKIKKYNKFN